MMKKSVLSLMVGAALLIAPLTASALTPMTADGLKSATGQAGVDIAIDNVKIESWIGKTRYTDMDGNANVWLGTTDADNATDGASLVIGQKHTVKYFNAITDGTLSSTANAVLASELITPPAGVVNALALANIADPSQSFFIARPLSIDVGTCEALSAGLEHNSQFTTATVLVNGSEFTGNAHDDTNNAITGVVIGLPTLEIITTADEYAVGIEGSGYNDGKDFIKIQKSASVMCILNGTVEIAPH